MKKRTWQTTEEYEAEKREEADLNESRVKQIIIRSGQRLG